MRRDHRTHAQAFQQCAHGLCAHSGACRLGDDVSESARQLLVAALGLDAAATAHGAVLFRDGQKLEPDALRLQRAREYVGRIAGCRGLAEENGFNLGLVLAHHLQEQLEEQVAGLDREAVGLRGIGLGQNRRSGLVHHGAVPWRWHAAASWPPRKASEPAPFTGAGQERGYARTRVFRLARASFTVVPRCDGLGATISPNDFMISDFSGALSPNAEMIAPAWPIFRPFGAVMPAT